MLGLTFTGLVLWTGWRSLLADFLLIGKLTGSGLYLIYITFLALYRSLFSRSSPLQGQR